MFSRTIPQAIFTAPKKAATFLKRALSHLYNFSLPNACPRSLVIVHGICCNEDTSPGESNMRWWSTPQELAIVFETSRLTLSVVPSRGVRCEWRCKSRKRDRFVSPVRSRVCLSLPRAATCSTPRLKEEGLQTPALSHGDKNCGNPR